MIASYQGYQPGDQSIVIAGDTYHLRLTLGALAEISARFGGGGPLHLAQVFRNLNDDAARTLLACLLRPCLPSEDVDRLAASASSPEIAAAMSAITEIINKTFRGENAPK
ncbi:GTA-gp10 family protein [Litorimonas sp. RW-G-Af-16]|uniref:GTA-gp10 family protein n=1 Tax=Litorimonas sp. RW-G-Af-16 TaxID=3241168 RepID=UPI00390C7395